MSYDIYLKETHVCGECSVVNRAFDYMTDVTYNIKPMLEYAGVTLQDLESVDGQALVASLSKLNAFLIDPSNRRVLRAMQDPLAWGTLGGLQHLVYELYSRSLNMQTPRLDIR